MNRKNDLDTIECNLNPMPPEILPAKIDTEERGERVIEEKVLTPYPKHELSR